MRKAFALVLATFLISSAVISQDNKEVLRKIDEENYVINENIFINLPKKEISFEAEINMTSGPIEVMLAGKNGKLHEAVFKTNIWPSHLQVALLLLDYSYGRNIDTQGENTIPEGQKLHIEVEWECKNGRKKIFSIEKFAYNIIKKEEMIDTYWVFLGSKIVEGQYMADVQQSIITTYRDPYAVIDNPLNTGTNDEIYSVNEDIVPAANTKVKIVIKPYKSI